MLKLISTNPINFYRRVLSEGLEEKLTQLKPLSQNTFLCEFQKISTNLYVLRAHDPYHGLVCEMTLELRETFGYCETMGFDDRHLISVLVSDFPYIDTKQLDQKIFHDSYLQAMLTIQFQLKILEQLFLLSENLGAVNLVLNFGDYNQDYIEIYQHFLISQEDVTSAHGDHTEIVIPTDVDTYDHVIDFMDLIDHQFQETLWNEQKTNAAFRHYLRIQHRN